MKNKVLIILGMHRSGTSLLSGWLQSCGLALGDRLLGASTGNVEGHFEDVDFLEFHRDLLANRKLSKEGMIAKSSFLLTDKEKEKMSRLVNWKNVLHEEWGWKEPRTCLFLNYYNEILPDAYYLIIVRNYEAVISSLITRMYNRTINKYATKQGISRFLWEYYKKKRRIKYLLRKYSSYYLKVWINYNQQILRLIDQIPPDRYQILNQNVLLKNDLYIFNTITTQWYFKNLCYQPFCKVYKKELQSRELNVKPYIKNKRLLAEADALLFRLNSAAVLNTDK